MRKVGLALLSTGIACMMIGGILGLLASFYFYANYAAGKASSYFIRDVAPWLLPWIWVPLLSGFLLCCIGGAVVERADGRIE
jgi:hypothetical protein